jgi:fructose-bisphosphate aldolase class II
MLISSKDLLLTARQFGFAFPHFNYWNDLSLKAHIAAAEAKNVPVLVAWAEKHESAIEIDEALALGKFFSSGAKVPVVLHLDHGTTPDLVKYGIDHGFTSVMIDASFESFAKNVAITRDIVAYGHQRGVVVEAEIGHVGTSLNDDDQTHYTEVEAAKEFVTRTHVDSLAVSIGTAHGVYKGGGTPRLNFERLHDLREAIETPLVLHGGSSSGDANLSRAAVTGITKVNIFTDLANVALQTAQDGHYDNEFDLLAAEQAAIQHLDEHYIEVFNTTKFLEVAPAISFGSRV